MHVHACENGGCAQIPATLFAAHSPTFDELVYEDDDTEKLALIKECGLDTEDADRSESPMKTVHLYDVEPQTFDHLYDVFLGAPVDINVGVEQLVGE